MHRHSPTLCRRNVKQEICNSYHLEGTFDPVVSHWSGYPLQSGIRRPCIGGRSPPGRVFIVRVSGTTREGPMKVNFDCGSMQKEAAIRVGCYVREGGDLC